MADSYYESPEGEDSVHGEKNNNLLGSTLARMASYFERQENRGDRGNRNMADAPEDVALERFHKFRPPKFNGKGGEEVAEGWMESMNDIYDTLRYSEERKVAFGKYQLEGPAKAWWRIIEEKWRQEDKPSTWEAFLAEFRKKYIPVVVREKREEEFMYLKQRSLTVSEYEEKFTQLSKYAPEMVNTEEKRRRRFMQGLRMEIQDALVTAVVTTYAGAVEMAQRVEDSKAKMREVQSAKRAGPKTWGQQRTGTSQGNARPPQRKIGGTPQKRAGGPSTAPPAKRAAPSQLCNYCGRGNHLEKDCWRKGGQCLLCGSTAHQVRDCPRSQAGGGPVAPSGSGPQKKIGPANKAKVPARVYAIDKQDVESDADVVEGTLSISGVLAKVLIDPGSTHSFARPGFLKRLEFKSELLDYLIEVSTPTGGKKIETDKVYRKCKVQIYEKEFPADLISLPINGYDVILGMDWLSQYYVNLDCKTKEVSLCVPGESVVRLNFKKAPKSVEVVSGEKARKLLWKGATGYLAYIVNQPKDKTQVGQVPVVKEFSDVFPEELNTLPPEREVKFVIDLLPGATPLSKTPYRMAPAELKELKEQL